MPKEITHWIAAERIRNLIEPGSIKEAIRKKPLFYYLGAVIYDSPFYAYGVKHTGTFKEIAERLHDGVEGDTFEPIRAFISSLPANPPDEGLSFIAGVFTHYSMDVTFHPMVNYFSGKYASDDPAKRIDAQVRHRTLEGLMDLYFSGIYAKESDCSSAVGLGSCLINRGHFSRVLKGLLKNGEDVDEMVGRLYGIDLLEIPIRPLLNCHGLIQRQLFRPLLSAGLNLAGKIVGGPLAVIASTFYPALKTRALLTPSSTFKFFAAPIVFTHPNTGEALRGSAEDLAARAAMTAADLINGYQDLLKYGKGGSYLTGKWGLSLSYGCDVAQYPEPVHFDTDTPIHELCRVPCPPGNMP